MKIKDTNISPLLNRLLVIFMCFSLCAAKAQPVKVLDLEETIQLATMHDLQLKADSAKVSMLNERVKSSKRAKLPDIDINLNYTRISDNINPFKVAFPAGEVILNPQILNQSYNSLQLKQLIWDGGRVRYGIEISTLELESVKYGFHKDRVNTVYNASVLWYNLYVSKTSKLIIEANIKTLLATQADVRNFVTQGIVLENDALKIDLAITNLQSNLIDITNAINALTFNICTITGLPTNTTIELAALNQLNSFSQLGIETYLTSALANRWELKGMQNSVNIAALGLKLSQKNYLPTVSGIASGNYNLPEQRVFPNQDRFQPTWFIGVNVKWPISSLYKNSSRVNESKQLIATTTYMYEQAREQILIEVNAAYTDYLQAAQKITISTKAVEQATENFRVEQNRLMASTITTTDFLVANTNLLQSKLNLNTAIANEQLAFRRLVKTSLN